MLFLGWPGGPAGRLLLEANNTRRLWIRKSGIFPGCHGSEPSEALTGDKYAASRYRGGAGVTIGKSSGVNGMRAKKCCHDGQHFLEWYVVKQIQHYIIDVVIVACGDLDLT